MIYPKEFFDLQWHFAERVSTLAAMPVARALLNYTNFYARFGLGRDVDAGNPVWRDYLECLHRDTTAPREATYRFYQSRLPDPGPPGVIATVGCFSIAQHAEGRLRLHFHNAEARGVSPLAAHRAPQRRDELRKLFERVRLFAPPEAPVVGSSWLYNLPAYRALFPAPYLASATRTSPNFRGMPLWGQFLDRSGAVRAALADEMLARLARQAGAQRLEDCFPLQVLNVGSPASVFA